MVARRGVRLLGRLIALCGMGENDYFITYYRTLDDFLCIMYTTHTTRFIIM